MKVSVPLALVLVSPAYSLESPPYIVDAGKILAVAIVAVNGRYPGISPDDLELEHNIYVHCGSTRPNEQIFALDEEFMPCIAGVNFDLASANAKSQYIDQNGNCTIATDPNRVNVQVHMDRIHVGMDRGSGTTDRVVECTEEFITQALASPEMPFDDKPYIVDAKKILEIAFAAVIEKYPDVSPHDLDLDVLVRLTCKSTQVGERISALDVKFAPCTAKVKFAVKSVTIEYKYIDEDGRCMIGEASDFVRVQVNADSSTHVSSRNRFTGGTELEVECTEEFNNLPELTHNKSLNTDASKAGAA